MTLLSDSLALGKKIFVELKKIVVYDNCFYVLFCERDVRNYIEICAKYHLIKYLVFCFRLLNFISSKMA